MSMSYRFNCWLTGCTLSALQFLLGKVLYAGGPGYRIAEWLYIITFDRSLRQKSSINERIQDQSSHSLVDWQNPEVVGRKRKQMHFKSRSFTKRSHAIEYWRRKKHNVSTKDIARDNVMLLTGRPGHPDDSHPWQFLLVGEPSQAPSGWFLPQYATKDSPWSLISLPNHWQLQGFDVPMYTNTVYPFRFDPPFTVRDGEYSMTACDEGLGAVKTVGVHPNEPGPNATGLYRREFLIPSNWGVVSPFDNRVFLVFEGVDSNLTVWVNGKLAGYSQDSCLSAEFDITELLHGHSLDSNTIAVQVGRWCDGSYLEDQDKWWLSGIYREAYLIQKPPAFIADFEFVSDIDFTAEKVNAELTVSVLAEGVSTRVEQAEAVFARKQPPHAVRIELWENIDDAKPFATCVSEFYPQANFGTRQKADVILNSETADHDILRPQQPGLAEVKLHVDAPKLWSAENPQLYYLVLTLYGNVDEAQQGGEGVHSEAHKVGIRSVVIGGDDNTLMVNNRPITIAGVNRLEFDPLTGRAISKESMLSDAKLLKSLNFNAIRTAHYPQHTYILDVCDEVGLYCIDEANIETHGFQVVSQPAGYLSHAKEWRGALSSRVCRMYERDKNHACIIGWSLGNESGHGPTHDLMADWLRARDPRRFVQYESGGSRTYATDIICPMYQHPAWCVEQCNTDTKKRPVILCEYAHAMGNSGGCLQHYWRLFRDDREPRFQGGFIWDFVDQGLVDKEIPGQYKYGGDFGDLPHSGNFCCNGLMNPDRVPHPDAFETAYLQAPTDIRLLVKSKQQLVVVVKNQRDFVSLADLRITITPKVQIQPLFDAVTLQSFDIFCGDIAAKSSKEIDIGSQLKAVLQVQQSSLLQQIVAESYIAAVDKSVPVVWLDVSVVKVAKSSNWNSQDVELQHLSLSEFGLYSFLLQQLNIQSFHPLRKSSYDPHARIDVTDNAEHLVLKWSQSQMELVFNKRCGRLISWMDVNGNELLSMPMDLNLYRAITDNDRGGSIFSHESAWKAAGYHDLQRKVLNSKNQTCKLVFAVHPNTDIEVSVEWVLIPPTEVMNCIEIPCSAKFYCHANSKMIDITYQTTPPAYLPPLPRVGIRFAFPTHFDQVKWFGLGPHEAYDDRKSCAYLGVFDRTVDELHTHYVVPQENGRRADTRWVTFTNSKNNNESIAILPNYQTRKTDHEVDVFEGKYAARYGFNASRYSMEQLDRCKHDYKLQSEKMVHVQVDSRTMGVGGYDSWSPNVGQEFLVCPDGKPFVTRFSMLHTTK